LYVGGVLINSESSYKWRNNIGYVSQMPLILDGSIAENIALGINLSDIDIEKLQNSSRIANLTEWIEALPDSYDTPVGERGVKISGGQRQRIAIARAFYHNAEYLFFDEATSSLDTITESNIMSMIENLAGIKTIIMIAHRLNTVKNCDWIYNISDGVIKSEGTYQYLIENDNNFSKMAGVE
jgi:ABC-type multidrug transport system fused ATPase/permease subunit